MKECSHHEGYEPHQCPECNAQRADEQYERARERAGFDKPLEFPTDDWQPPAFVMVGTVTEANPDYKKLIEKRVAGITAPLLPEAV